MRLMLGMILTVSSVSPLFEISRVFLAKADDVDFRELRADADFYLDGHAVDAQQGGCHHLRH